MVEDAVNQGLPVLSAKDVGENDWWLVGEMYFIYGRPLRIFEALEAVKNLALVVYNAFTAMLLKSPRTSKGFDGL